MKFVPEQCKQCPFRKTSAPGWLGSYDPGSVFRSIWKGFPFFCHFKANYKRKDWEAHLMKYGKLCVGGLAFANKMLAPDREIQHEPIRIAREQVKLIDVECMTPQEFAAHHERKETP
jgi:hypothetical protein